MLTFLEFVSNKIYCDKDGADLIEGLKYWFTPDVGGKRKIKIVSISNSAMEYEDEEKKIRKVSPVLFRSLFKGNLAPAF